MSHSHARGGFSLRWLAGALWLLPCASLAAQSAGFAPGSGGIARSGGLPPSLDQVPVPRPANLADFVKNEAVAVQLGKALFWDQSIGSDGRDACATCHHAAGVDSRTLNTMNPGANGLLQNVAAGGRLRAGNFPILTDDVVGSQGQVDTDFVNVVIGSGVDNTVFTPNPVFGAHQQVTGRQAPSSINAIFNRISFWDGRANNTFDGRSVKNDGVAVLQVQADGSVLAVHVALTNSSAASQSVGPPNSDVEMAGAGRTFPDIGKKMLALRPLSTQNVHFRDSVLGSLRDPSGVGLKVSYASLIQGAFQDQWWNSNAIFDRAGTQIGTGTPNGLNEFSLMESNFSLFWGLAVQAYEATLVSSDSPFDRFARGDATALTARQQDGMGVFFGKGQCSKCHGGSEFTNASVNNDPATAFNFIGVDPLAFDGGNANGQFKTAQLRNVELTGPYFHNGKYVTLRQVVDFYARGGDVPNGAIQQRSLSSTDKDALVDFLVSLTDDRVRFQRAPFDHPSLNPANRTPVPAVGAQGAAKALGTFLGLSPFTP